MSPAASRHSHNNVMDVFLNNGDSTFAEPVSFATGANPLSVTTADFDGDSKLDVAVAILSDTSLAVALNRTCAVRVARFPNAKSPKRISRRRDAPKRAR
ncbi:MAG TPA: VCBS repeat-containing protein [Polyangiaceae bacterium]|jgi:hypothetical protein|nr:VCBS repeat-containing protein [Polyangiaceae bacterium]